MSRQNKAEQIQELIAAYRANSSQDGAFDALAAERLGIGPTDLRCLDIVQGRGGVTAGELATASGLIDGAVTAVVDRLERAGSRPPRSRRVRPPQGERRGDRSPLPGGRTRSGGR